MKISRAVPVSFRKKVDLFKRIHVDTDLMRPIAKEATELLESVVPLLQDRHFIVHGYYLYDEKDLEGWMLERHEFVEGGMRTIQRYFTRSELMELASKLTKIQIQAATYINLVTAQIQDHYPNDN